MTKAKDGDKVAVDYTMKTADGAVFYSSAPGSPLRFTIGSGEIIAGFDQAVAGMEPGEIKQLSVPPEMAFGLHRGRRVQHLKPGWIQPDDPGRAHLSVVIRTPGAMVSRDYNHPLAGHIVTFVIKLVAIEAPEAAVTAPTPAS